MKNIKNISIITFYLFLLTFLTSCEEVIDYKLPAGKSELYVDGLICNNGVNQKIYLKQTVDYLDNTTQRPVSGAQVLVVNDKLTFLDTLYESPTEPGTYIIDSLFGEVGDIFNLVIVENGDTFVSQSQLNRPIQLDSLVQGYRESEFGNDAGIYMDLYARDIVGQGDFYWLRWSLNGVMNQRPAEIMISADGVFSPGNSDGLDLIYPIRNFMNTKPFEINDSVTVEILSLDLFAWIFLSQVQTQTNNTGLFASPQANVPTNIMNIKKEGRKALGWFTIANKKEATVVVK